MPNIINGEVKLTDDEKRERASAKQVAQRIRDFVEFGIVMPENDNE